MATYPVKYINDSMRGAPQLSGTAGTLIAVLDAFLLTGFGQVTALAVTVADGIATASVQPGQTFDVGCVVLVEGSTQSALNGEARVLSASNTSITWATDAPPGAAGGAIHIKVAPVGWWEKKFSSGNVAVYRSTHPLASGFCWRVDDSGATFARTRGFEAMSDVDTGLGPFPTNAQLNNGGYLHKSTTAGAAAVPYDFAADAQTILAAIASGRPSGATFLVSPIRGFGDMLPLRPSGDGFAVALPTNVSTNTVFGAFDTTVSGASAVYLARSHTGIGGAVSSGARAYVTTSDSGLSGNDPYLGAFPSSVDGALRYCRRYIYADDGVTPRAEVPGVLHIPQSGVRSSISARDVLTGTGELAGRKLVALNHANGSAITVAPGGLTLLDITGPWR